MNLKEIVARIREINPSDTILLSFSRGKDSWGCWCALRDYFDIQPYYYYNSPPNMEFKIPSFEYAEKKMGKRVIRLPSPLMYSLLSAKGLVYQPPQRVLALLGINLFEFYYDVVQQAAIDAAHLPKGTFSALGVRACDSARRKLHFKTHGPISEAKLKFYPIWDWDKNKLMDELKRNNVELPIDYKLFGRTFDGLHLLYLENIKRHFPKDWETIMEYFPLIDMELYRHEKRKALGF